MSVGCSVDAVDAHGHSVRSRGRGETARIDGDVGEVERNGHIDGTFRSRVDRLIAGSRDHSRIDVDERRQAVGLDVDDALDGDVLDRAVVDSRETRDLVVVAGLAVERDLDR